MIDLKESDLSKHFFSRQSTIDAVGNRASVYASSSAPTSNSISNITEGERDIGSLVVGLLCLSRPLTILRRVITVIINPIQTVFSGRLLAHISNKVRELAPSITDSNASSSVVFERVFSFVGATLSHVFPSDMFRGKGLTVSRASLNHEASTGFSAVLASKVIVSDNASIPTRTDAVEPSVATVSTIDRNNGKAVKGKADKVGIFHNILHSMLSIRKNVAICMEAELRVAFPSHKHMIA